MGGKKTEGMTEATDSKIKPHKDIQATTAMVSSLAKETRSPLTVGVGRTCTNGGSQKDEYSYSMPKSVGRICILQSIYYKSRWEKLELLQL